MSLTDDQMFGPTSLDGAKPFFSQFNLFPGHTRGAPPFRKGQIVTQTSGPHASRNRRCEVEDVAYVTNSEFTGWAIRLVGRASPYAAEHFEALTAATPETEHEVRVEYAAGARAYRITIDGDIRFSLAESLLMNSPWHEVEDRIRSFVGTESRLLAQVYGSLKRMLDDFPLADHIPAAPPEPPAPSVRRRIVRRNKK